MALLTDLPVREVITKEVEVLQLILTEVVLLVTTEEILRIELEAHQEAVVTAHLLQGLLEEAHIVVAQAQEVVALHTAQAQAREVVVLLTAQAQVQEVQVHLHDLQVQAQAQEVVVVLQEVEVGDNNFKEANDKSTYKNNMYDCNICSRFF